jgi:hypothetical protein
MAIESSDDAKMVDRSDPAGCAINNEGDGPTRPPRLSVIGNS